MAEFEFNIRCAVNKQGVRTVCVVASHGENSVQGVGTSLNNTFNNVNNALK